MSAFEGPNRHRIASGVAQVYYKSALFMMHRIRWAMTDEWNAPLEGIVEVDETYVGGKPRYRGRVNQGKVGRGTDKPPILAMVERGGSARAAVLGPQDEHPRAHFLEFWVLAEDRCKHVQRVARRALRSTLLHELPEAPNVHCFAELMKNQFGQFAVSQTASGLIWTPINS